MRPIRISVTKDHIRRGVRRSTCDCPIALALKEALLTSQVSVDSTEMRINHIAFDTDYKDRQFINRFDEGKPVKPYSFELNR